MFNGTKSPLHGLASLALLMLILGSPPLTNVVSAGVSSFPGNGIRGEDSRRTAVASQAHLYDRSARTIDATVLAKSRTNDREIPTDRSYAHTRMVESLLTVVELEHKIYPVVRSKSSSHPQPPAHGSLLMPRTGVSSSPAPHVGTVVLLI